MRTLYDETYKRGADSPAPTGGAKSSRGWRQVIHRVRAPIRRWQGAAAHGFSDAIGGMQSRSDTLREPRLGISTATDTGGLSVTGVSSGVRHPRQACAWATDHFARYVTITNDDSFGTFRERYTGTALTTLPLVIRRGTETITLNCVRLFSRTVTVVTSIPGAPEKASAFANGIMKGTTQ